MTNPDELSYIINARNSCLAIDAGYGQDFPEYSTWYTQPLSHNLVMTNDSAPMDFATNQTPYDRHFLTTLYLIFQRRKLKHQLLMARFAGGLLSSMMTIGLSMIYRPQLSRQLSIN